MTYEPALTEEFPRLVAHLDGSPGDQNYDAGRALVLSKADKWSLEPALQALDGITCVAVAPGLG